MEIIIVFLFSLENRSHSFAVKSAFDAEKKTIIILELIFLSTGSQSIEFRYILFFMEYGGGQFSGTTKFIRSNIMCSTATPNH